MTFSNRHSGNLPRVAVLDLSIGNIFSVMRSLEYGGALPVLTSSPDMLDTADGIVLPGVGAFGEAMKKLEDTGLKEALFRAVDKEMPILGICLGFQLLFDRSFEFGEHRGLGLLRGEVLPLREAVANECKVPSIGWYPCRLTPSGFSSRIFEGFPDLSKMYFLHSYFVKPQLPEDVFATTASRDFEYCVAGGRNQIVGVQFHPELSAIQGQEIFKRFCEYCSKYSGTKN